MEKNNRRIIEFLKSEGIKHSEPKLDTITLAVNILNRRVTLSLMALGVSHICSGMMGDDSVLVLKY